MNLPRSTSRLEMIMAQGPNMWWNLRKSRICTMPKRKDQANIWFLINKIFNNKNTNQANIWFLNTNVTDLEILVTHTQAPDVEENVCVVLWKCE